jgi:hypothetical protein
MPLHDIYYTVQVGAFASYDAACAYADKVNKSGFHVYPDVENCIYIVRSEAFYNDKHGAELYAQELKDAGITSILKKYGDPAMPEKTIDQIAQEVANGLWGSGYFEITQRLREANHPVSLVLTRLQLLK